jgi:hypothetical protein
VIAKNDHEQVFAKIVFALQELLVLQRVLVLLVARQVQPVQVFARQVQVLLVQKLPLVWVVFHHEVLLQLVHSLMMQLLKNYLQNYLGYKF